MFKQNRYVSYKSNKSYNSNSNTMVDTAQRSRPGICYLMWPTHYTWAACALMFCIASPLMGHFNKTDLQTWNSFNRDTYFNTRFTAYLRWNNKIFPTQLLNSYMADCFSNEHKSRTTRFRILPWPEQFFLEDHFFFSFFFSNWKLWQWCTGFVVVVVVVAVVLQKS